MIIRYRTTKAPKGQQITGRGETPAKLVRGISPERATEGPATPLGFSPACRMVTGASPLPMVLSALRAFLVVCLRIIIKNNRGKILMQRDGLKGRFHPHELLTSFFYNY